MTTPLLEANNLGYIRCANKLFSGISFALMPGELLHVIGSNGSGKTSLLKLLSGLLPVEYGSVVQHTRRLAYIGHKLGIKLGLTVTENLREMAVLHNVFDPLILTQAMQRFELIKFSHLLCAYLSAGQRQRVALARLSLLNTQLWVLDEPFAHLDKESCAIVVQCISEHCAAEGSVVLASHQQQNIPVKQRTLLLS